MPEQLCLLVPINKLRMVVRHWWPRVLLLPIGGTVTRFPIWTRLRVVVVLSRG